MEKIVGGPDSVWGPIVGPTGDPKDLDPSEVPDDLPISFLHGASESGGRCPFW